EGDLQRMRPLRRADPLQRGDALPLEVADLALARGHILAVDDHRAGPALPGAAAEPGRLQVELAAQHIEQGAGVVDVEATRLAVDGEFNVSKQMRASGNGV